MLLRSRPHLGPLILLPVNRLVAVLVVEDYGFK